ncbi:aminotransferase class I/II-fold pyridoxal phosphate-dependent enzyme [Rudanella paleaurantiibacter]|uniref:Aminotransferase class I/II-fold pyridoxal phosphate-dependent enzyme n=1 Tax=Rudanella paleaurantiibacter TaxID=2614655 RepID=A0A7J5TX12_9BACT|nr:DegT/DnrJ/EryC1/StrS family aminotransferase [Rudanella paleaurantiibacter]KAB7729179.1 aminotransferase class I/II-fold pyridoxal phosphate-dependent enzyme [Rudanella paleaurantiibacter]
MTDTAALSIPLSTPHQTGTELNRLQTTPADLWAEWVPEFEQALAQSVSSRFALATQSGTAALELALRTLGIGPGDTVICPTLTFAATANAIRSVGAQPIFVGSEPESWGLDPDALETALQRERQRLRAILVVDLYGMPANWPALQEVADRYDLPLVADAAESLGAELNGRACGTLGLLNAVSFNLNKVITTYGGGALLTNGPQLAVKARVVANQGRQLEPPFCVVEPGSNYRMGPLNAGFGLDQLPFLADRVKARRAIFERYYGALSQVPGLMFQPERAGAFSNRWLTALRLDPVRIGITRDAFIDRLRREHIETRPVFMPLHRQRAFADCHFYGGSETDAIANEGLCLPSGSALTDAQVERVIDRVRRALVKK